MPIVEKYTPEYAAPLTGVDAELIKKAAEMYAGGPKSAVYWGMGVAQHTTAVGAVNSLANLTMITGMIGKESTGANPLRGQNNVQGACDMACLVNQLPGYQPYDNEAAVERFANAWGGISPPKNPGKAMTVQFIPAGEMKSVYVIGANPAHSHPNVTEVRQVMEDMDFLVVQDIFMTETGKRADVVLPATTILEKYGTTTNSERRVQINRPAVTPPGDAKPDLWIMLEIMKRMGFDISKHKDITNEAQTSREVMAEISIVVPQYAGVTYEKIEANNKVMWPMAVDATEGTRFLHGAAFPRGKGLIKAVEYVAPDEEPDAEYPMLLTTGRTLYHWHGMTLTEKSEGIMQVQSGGYIEINPTDAAKLGVVDGDKVNVTSRRGQTIAPAKVLDTIKEGIVFIPFHFKDTLVNLVTNPALDPLAKEPEYKVCAVKLEKA
jgi:predicted molibdopterin-dependent oxidoreductase YjgC